MENLLLALRAQRAATGGVRSYRGGGQDSGARAKGYVLGVDVEARIESVERTQTRGGNTRFVVRDDAGREFTTFRPAIGEEAARLEGRRARIEFHEEDRNGFHNVYLDGVAEVADEAPPAAGGGTDPDEVAWSTAVEAAPWVLGSSEPEREVPPEELFEKLEPFKRLVADDIRRGGEAEDDEPAG
jgi:hypothetical protein